MLGNKLEKPHPVLTKKKKKKITGSTSMNEIDIEAANTLIHQIIKANLCGSFALGSSKINMKRCYTTKEIFLEQLQSFSNI